MDYANMSYPPQYMVGQPVVVPAYDNAVGITQSLKENEQHNKPNVWKEAVTHGAVAAVSVGTVARGIEAIRNTTLNNQVREQAKEMFGELNQIDKKSLDVLNQNGNFKDAFNELKRATGTGRVNWVKDFFTTDGRSAEHAEKAKGFLNKIPVEWNPLGKDGVKIKDADSMPLNDYILDMQATALKKMEHAGMTDGARKAVMVVAGIGALAGIAYGIHKAHQKEQAYNSAEDNAYGMLEDSRIQMHQIDQAHLKAQQYEMMTPSAILNAQQQLEEMYQGPMAANGRQIMNGQQGIASVPDPFAQPQRNGQFADSINMPNGTGIDPNQFRQDPSLSRAEALQQQAAMDAMMQGQQTR